MADRQSEHRSLPYRIRYLLGAAALLPAPWQLHAQTSSGVRPNPVPVVKQVASQTPYQLNQFRSGLGDHLTDIADLTGDHNRQVDLQDWKKRVNFLAAQPGITDIRVDIAASDVAVYSKGRLAWNARNLSLYGAAFDYARARNLNIILVAMPLPRQVNMSDAQYRAMIDAYYGRLGVFAAAHGITDINLNELGAHNPITGRPVSSFTPAYLAEVVSLAGLAWHAIETRVPHARLIVSESAAMTDEATKRLLAVFAALKAAGIPFIRALNIYAGGHIEIGEIDPLIEDVAKGGEVWVTEFAFSSVGVKGEKRQAKGIGQIFERIVESGARVAIGYEEMDEPRLQRLRNLPAAEKHYGIVWRRDGSLKPAGEVFFGIARENSAGNA